MRGAEELGHNYITVNGSGGGGGGGGGGVLVVVVMKEFMACAAVYILWRGKGVLDNTLRECVVRG